jgi:hypothetical protein
MIYKTNNRTRFYRLTVGSAVGSIRDLFVKIKAIDAKHGKFDCVLCIGDFFGPLKELGALGNGPNETEQLLNGDIEGGITFHKCYTLTELFRSQSL